jgi:hypothetical protein
VLVFARQLLYKLLQKETIAVKDLEREGEEKLVWERKVRYGRRRLLDGEMSNE